MGRPVDGKPFLRGGLRFRRGVTGDATGDEGAELGVAVIPGRDTSRSRAGRRPFVLVETVGIVSIAALALGVVVGFAPIAASLTVAVLVPAAVIDVEQRRLPDGWVLASLLTLIAAVAIGAVAGGLDGVPFGGLAAGALAMGLPVLLLHLVSPAAMGFGDVKTSVVLGAGVGTIDWRLGAVALCLAALVGGIVGVVGRRHTIPFGPFLVFGAWVTVLGHEPILSALFTNGATS